MTLRELVEKGEARLLHVSGGDAAFEAKQLLLFLLGWDETAFLLRKNETAKDSEAEAYLKLIKQREQNVPLQYILGSWDFYGNTFEVGPGVLIPRPETEDLVSLCLELISPDVRTVIDLCAGSGCIGITLALRTKDCTVYAVEKYPEAFSYLQKNAASLCPERVVAVAGDVKDPALSLPSPDLIVSNPPYIAASLIQTLSEEVKSEPRTALDGGADGLDFYRAIADVWLPRLRPGGWCVVECAEDQTDAVAALFDGFGTTQTHFDIYGKKRFVSLNKLEVSE